ncbi:MAG: hypothetical protein ACMUHB_02810 [Thermoplasmatota archaeon]
MRGKDLAFFAVITTLVLLASILAYFVFQKDPDNEYTYDPSGDLDRFLFPDEMAMNSTIDSYLRSSGDYLVKHIQTNGKWDYEYDPVKDENLKKYNILRHAGTTYSLALIFKYTRDPDYHNGTVNSLNYLLSKHLRFGEMEGDEIAFMVDNGYAKLGGAALTILAIVEVEEIDPEARYERELNALGEFILKMQKKDGSFQCFYLMKEDEHSDFYPGEALLALARMYDHTRDDRYLQTLIDGLDHYNGYFGTGYTAYTPWATEAMAYAYNWTGNTSLLDHSYRMAESCRAGQNLPREGIDPYIIGGWGSEPKANTASRVEGVTDAYLMAKRAGDTDRQERYGQTMEYSSWFLLSLQFDDEESQTYPSPEMVVGGTPLGHSDHNIRIDYVQHAVVVMVKIMVYRGSSMNI